MYWCWLTCLTVLCFLGDLVVIWAQIGLGALRVILYIKSKLSKRHKKDSQAGKWTLFLHFSTYLGLYILTILFERREGWEGMCTCFCCLAHHLPCVPIIPCRIVHRSSSLALTKTHTDVSIFGINVHSGAHEESLQKQSGEVYLRLPANVREVENDPTEFSWWEGFRQVGSIYFVNNLNISERRESIQVLQSNLVAFQRTARV